MIPFRIYDLGESLRLASAKVNARIDAFSDAELMANDINLLCRNVYE